MKTLCGSLTQPSKMFDLSSCQVLELLFDEVFKDSCIWSWFASGAGIMEGVGLCPKVWAPQTHVYNLSPYGIFLRACSSLNYPPGSQSWESNCPIKLFLKVLWQVQQCRSFSYAVSPHLFMSSPFILLCYLPILAQVLQVNNWDMYCRLIVCNTNNADSLLHVTSFAGEVYILASSKSMVQSHSGKLYKLVDPKRYNHEVHFLFLSGWFVSHLEGGFEGAIFFQSSYVCRLWRYTFGSRLTK